MRPAAPTSNVSLAPLFATAQQPPDAAPQQRVTGLAASGRIPSDESVPVDGAPPLLVRQTFRVKGADLIAVKEAESRFFNMGALTQAKDLYECFWGFVTRGLAAGLPAADEPTDPQARQVAASILVRSSMLRAAKDTNALPMLEHIVKDPQTTFRGDLVTEVEELRGLAPTGFADFLRSLEMGEIETSEGGPGEQALGTQSLTQTSKEPKQEDKGKDHVRETGESCSEKALSKAQRKESASPRPQQRALRIGNPVERQPSKPMPSAIFGRLVYEAEQRLFGEVGLREQEEHLKELFAIAVPTVTQSMCDDGLDAVAARVLVLVAAVTGVIPASRGGVIPGYEYLDNRAETALELADAFEELKSLPDAQTFLAIVMSVAAPDLDLSDAQDAARRLCQQNEADGLQIARAVEAKRHIRDAERTIRGAAFLDDNEAATFERGVSNCLEIRPLPVIKGAPHVGALCARVLVRIELLHAIPRHDLDARVASAARNEVAKGSREGIHHPAKTPERPGVAHGSQAISKQESSSRVEPIRTVEDTSFGSMDRLTTATAAGYEVVKAPGVYELQAIPEQESATRVEPASIGDGAGSSSTANPAPATVTGQGQDTFIRDAAFRERFISELAKEFRELMTYIAYPEVRAFVTMLQQRIEELQHEHLYDYVLIPVELRMPTDDGKRQDEADLPDGSSA